MALSPDLLDILRCPSCVNDTPDSGLLTQTGDWLVCKTCDRKYPVRDDIPVMLVDEGERWQTTAVQDLPAANQA